MESRERILWYYSKSEAEVRWLCKCLPTSRPMKCKYSQRLLDTMPKGNQLYQDESKGAGTIDHRIQRPELSPTPKHRCILSSGTFEGIP